MVCYYEGHLLNSNICVTGYNYLFQNNPLCKNSLLLFE